MLGSVIRRVAGVAAVAAAGVLAGCGGGGGDGGTASAGQGTLPLALTVARKSQARVHLIHTHQRLDSPYAEMQVFDETLDAQMRGREDAYLKHTAEQVRAAYPGGQVTTGVLEGHIATRIAQEATNVGADLIVMTTHARGAMARFWLGSVKSSSPRPSTYVKVDAKVAMRMKVKSLPTPERRMARSENLTGPR